MGNDFEHVVSARVSYLFNMFASDRYQLNHHHQDATKDDRKPDILTGQ